MSIQSYISNIRFSNLVSILFTYPFYNIYGILILTQPSCVITEFLTCSLFCIPKIARNHLQQCSLES